MSLESVPKSQLIKLRLRKQRSAIEVQKSKAMSHA